MLKSGNHEMIASHIKQMQNEARKILNSIVELVWFMRGGIQYKDMLQMTPGERQIVSDFIKERMEKVVKSDFPVY